MMAWCCRSLRWTSHHHRLILRKEKFVAYASTLAYCPLSLQKCGEAIQNGKLVAFPTETVYGLGADALNAAAVQSIFSAKGRPLTDPVIVHVLNSSALDILFQFSVNSGDNLAQRVCQTLTSSFWPGPLTIVFRASSRVPPIVTAGTGFVGVRSPDHPVARELLEASNRFIAAPSANRFGHVSPTTSRHVQDDLSCRDILILDDVPSWSGGCKVGIESTVCRVSESGREISILRCGWVTSGDITSALLRANLGHVTVTVTATVKERQNTTGTEDMSDVDVAAVAPGQMVKHYAPDVPTAILRDNVMDCDLESLSRLRSTFIIDFHGHLGRYAPHAAVYVDLSPTGDAAEACFSVFEHLRRSELMALHGTIDRLLLPDLTEASTSCELVRALWERLHRAASGIYL